MASNTDHQNNSADVAVATLLAETETALADLAGLVGRVRRAQVALTQPGPVEATPVTRAVLRDLERVATHLHVVGQTIGRHARLATKALSQDRIG